LVKLIIVKGEIDMSRKLVKIASFVVTLSVLAVLLMSAGRQDASGGTGSVEVIRVWSAHAHEKDLRDQQVALFNEGRGKELGIKIEYQVFGGGWGEVIKTACQSGDAPDLFMPNIEVQDYVDAGFLIPISDLPGSEEFLKQYEGSLVPNEHIFNGKVITLPYNLMTVKFIINQDLFDKNGITDYPRTWADVRRYAKIITDNGGGREYGFVFGMKNNWVAQVYMTYLIAQSVGHAGFDNNTLQFRFSDMQPILDSVMGMFQDGSVLPGAAGFDADQMRAQFAEGRVGMIPGASFDVGVYTTQFLAKCNWKVVPVPLASVTGTKYKEFADSMTLLGVGASARKHPQKTLEVLKYFYSDECMAEMYEAGFHIPFRQEAIALAKRTPSAKGFAEFANTPDLALRLPAPYDIIPLEGEDYRPTIMAMFSGTLGNDTAAILADLDKRYNTALGKLDKKIVEEFRTPAGRNILAK
jgi:multiple sugar transport system substrate-binding protein